MLDHAGTADLCQYDTTPDQHSLGKAPEWKHTVSSTPLNAGFHRQGPRLTSSQRFSQVRGAHQQAFIF
jgi:hypothetical protein